jgi:hypothetical protein
VEHLQLPRKDVKGQSSATAAIKNMSRGESPDSNSTTPTVVATDHVRRPSIAGRKRKLDNELVRKIAMIVQWDFSNMDRHLGAIQSIIRGVLISE